MTSWQICRPSRACVVRGSASRCSILSAAARALELLRPIDSGTRKQTDITKREGAIDTPVGRYVHLELDGFDHRVYFEEAGQGGIPLLLQHTAGCHGSQWRHLFEDNRITSHFHLIAYDLPYHGKSLPPVEKIGGRKTISYEASFLGRYR